MDQVIQNLFDLLKYTLHQDSNHTMDEISNEELQETSFTDLGRMSKEEWLVVFQLGAKNSFLGFCYDGFLRIKNKNESEIDTKDKSEACNEQTPTENQEWYEEYGAYVERKAIQRVQYFYALKKIYEELGKIDIHPIIFKGISLAKLYKEPFLRQSSDDDMLIREEEMEEAKAVFLKEGYFLSEYDTKEKVWVYVHKLSFHKVEVHSCLWEDFEGEQMEILKQMELDRKDTLLKEQFRELSFWTLGYTEHLIYQMFHIIKHFTVEGITLKYFTDIERYVSVYESQIDWERFFDAMKCMGYEKFVRVFFTVCTRYLGMQKLTEMESFEDCEILITDMAYFKTSGNWQIIATMSPYLEGKASVSSNKMRRIMQMLFPGPSALQDDFSYAKRCVILLPVAWIHKWLRFLVNRLIRKKGASATEKMKLAEHRMEMLDQMGLLGGQK